MQIVRFRHDDAIAFGVVDGDEVVSFAGDPMFAGFETIDERIPLSEVTLLAPAIPRSKVIGVGRNYRAHATEMGVEAPGEPMLFLKPNTAVIGPGDTIVCPPESTRVEFEGELAVVIGRIAKRVPVASALDYVFGYTIGVDVTARDLQRADGQWSRAKGFDTFCPLGPGIETDWAAADARLLTRVNGVVRQDAPIADMIHSVAELISYASAAFTLLPGDVLLTGTPAGVGQLHPGDTLEVEISGLGTLRNPVG